MKLFRTLLALPLLGNVAFAAPTAYPYPEDISISQSPSAEGIAQAELERRSPTCKAIMKKLWNGPYIEVATVFVSRTSDYIKSVCERHGNHQCALYVEDVKEAFQLIFEIKTALRTGAAIADAANSVISNGRRSVPDTDVFSLEDLLKQHGYSYDSLEDDLPSGGVKTQPNEPALISRHVVRNARRGEGKTGHDFAIHQFEDGTGQLHAPLGGFGNETSMHKRHNGAGVKIAFKHINVIPAKAKSEGASAAIASKWQELAEAGHGEMFGYVAKSNKAYFYYRTIVEGDGFGNNYESVNACGDMTQYHGIE